MNILRFTRVYDEIFFNEYRTAIPLCAWSYESYAFF